jgi:hypothetical protein
MKLTMLPPRMVRCLKILKGVVALSPMYHWSTAKATAMAKNPTMSPMILESDQSYLMPPHWKTRRIQMRLQRISAVPSQSIARRRAVRDVVCGRCLTLRKKMMTGTTTGMQKRLR